MAVRQDYYRGYNVEIQHSGPRWRLRVTPSRPELPILSQHSFGALIPSWEGALDEAKRRIDRVLEEQSA